MNLGGWKLRCFGAGTWWKWHAESLPGFWQSLAPECLQTWACKRPNPNFCWESQLGTCETNLTWKLHLGYLSRSENKEWVAALCLPCPTWLLPHIKMSKIMQPCLESPLTPFSSSKYLPTSQARWWAPGTTGQNDWQWCHLLRVGSWMA